MGWQEISELSYAMTYEHFKDGNLIEHQFSINDDDILHGNESFVFEPTQIPAFLELSESGFLSGKPSHSDLGSHTIIVTVTDQRVQLTKRHYHFTFLTIISLFLRFKILK